MAKVQPKKEERKMIFGDDPGQKDGPIFKESRSNTDRISLWSDMTVYVGP